MKLLERYKQLSSEIEIFNKYYRCGEKYFGNMFFSKIPILDICLLLKKTIIYLNK